jgi:ribosomal protein L37AE/L43A
MKKFGINGQFRNKLFLNVIHRFSLVKAAVNAMCICKMCNGVNKTHLISSIFNCKGGTKTIAHFSIAEGWSF